jgi:aldose 1-epimerase
MSVTYSLKGSALRVDFGGETDQTTVFAPTVHPYFTLGGESVLQAKMQVNASGHLEVDSELIPSGVILPCEGKFDFAELREIRENLDDCFVISSEHACTVEYEGSRMEVWTDFPAIQVYTGAKLPAPYHANQGIAIEPEFYPDSPNHPNFPWTVLNPGDSFAKYVEYRFF